LDCFLPGISLLCFAADSALRLHLGFF